MKRCSLLLAIAIVIIGWRSSAVAVEVGEQAPDFDLVSTQGGKFKLSSMLGKKNVIVQFYVLDFTPT